MRLRDQYDWVVLGDHPGALLTACLAARLGLSVLVLRFRPGMKTLLSPSGQILDPESNFVLGLGRAENSNGLLFQCLHSCGVLESETQAIDMQRSLPQVITPLHRVLWRSHVNELQQEWAREFGSDQVKKSGLLDIIFQSEKYFSDYWSSFPQKLAHQSRFKEQSASARNLDELAKRIEKELPVKLSRSAAWLSRKKLISEVMSGSSLDSHFREICLGFARAFGSEQFEDCSAIELIQLMSLANTAGSFVGGMSAYRRFLYHFAQRLGAHIPREAECRRLFVEEGRFVGVQIAQRGKVIRVGGGVLGCSIDDARESISWSGQKRMNRLKRGPQADGWRFTLALTVNANAIPPGVSSRMFWQEEHAPAIEIEVVSPTDYGMSGADREVYLFARTLLPMSQEGLTVEYQRLMASRMLRQLCEVIPFLEQNIVRIYPDFRGGNLEISEVYGFASPEMIPENLRSVSCRGIGTVSGIESLYLASGESYPELGTLGPTVAALEATASIARCCGLPGPIAL